MLFKCNDTVYYKVAETNRKNDADFYNVLQNYADLNGDVSPQWLALYYIRYKGNAPIKADSLKIVTGNSSLPDGYTKGIHMFGEGGMLNLTSAYYCFNDTPKGTYVYYQVDDSVVNTASVAASTFSTGSAFLFGGIGAALGTGIAVAIMIILKKRKRAN